LEIGSTPIQILVLFAIILLSYIKNILLSVSGENLKSNRKSHKELGMKNKTKLLLASISESFFAIGASYLAAVVPLT
jgi:hypothetical protein